MRIISSFHDYYDSSIAYGIDPNCVYRRIPKEFDDQTKEYKDIMNFISSRRTKSLFRRIINNSCETSGHDIILFCGKLYWCIRVDITNTYPHRSNYHYTKESLFKSFGDKLKVKPSKPSYKSYRLYSFSMTEKEFDEVIFEFNQFREDDIRETLCRYGVPIIHIPFDLNDYGRGNSKKVILNPNLHSLQFIKKVDPITAFQELSMFISGILGGESPPMVQVSDLVRLEKHGFDRKTSFRKEKQQ